MTVKYLAAFAVSGILTVPLPISAGIQDAKAVELAGADEEDTVTRDQLLKAGQAQVPAPHLKMAEPKSTPLGKPVPEPQPGKKMADPNPEPKRAEPAKKLIEAKPKLAQPVKTAPEVAPKVTPAVEKKAVPEFDQRTIAAPYIRMDVGHGLALSLEGTTTAGDMTGEDVANLTLFGAGVGYRFSEELRVDMTADYRADAEIDAITPGGAVVSSEVNGLTMMLNGYYDIGMFEGFIPYVGGGFGFTRLETAGQTGTAAAGDTSTNLAWALSVGSSIDVGNGDNTMADVVYRFVSLGEFKQQDGTTYDDLMVHEFRVGFRYQL